MPSTEPSEQPPEREDTDLTAPPADTPMGEEPPTPEEPPVADQEEEEPAASEEEHPPLPEAPEASGEGFIAEQPQSPTPMMPSESTTAPETSATEEPPFEENAASPEETQEGTEEPPTSEETAPTSESPPEEGPAAGAQEATEPSEEGEEKEGQGALEEEMITPEMTHVDFDLLDIEGRWLLKVLSGPNTGAEFAIHGGSSYLIGTDTQACDIVFQDLSVSRKHARLTIDVKENAILEDLKSRNGTFVDGERIEKKTLSGNVLVSMGTTTFMLIDREAERTTIVAGAGMETKEAARLPLEAGKEAQAPLGPIQEAVMAPLQSEVEKVKEEERQQAKLSRAVSSLVILAVVTGLIMTIGIGGALLFRTQKVETPTVINPEAQISKTLGGFPAIRYSYNPTTSRLLLVGHVATATDRSRMLDIVTQLKFVRDVDYNNVVIDDQVWGEFNQVLAKNPSWRGISVTSPSAGRFVLTGFLRTRAQAEELFDYVSQNFPYVDLLERRVVVEEELLGQITRELNESGFQGVTPSLSGGNLTLAGSVGTGTKERFSKLVTVFKSLPGIRSVQVLVSEAGQKEAVVDLTSKYLVTGYSKAGNKVSVVINGRILAQGDTLDGMLITEITHDRVFLEKGSVKYKIDFNS
jgi:type III secretion system YscD/HrpQ family protein